MGITLKKQSEPSDPTTGFVKLYVDSVTGILTTKDDLGNVRPVGVGTADELATTGSPVDVSNSPPPTTGDQLTATSPTTAEWSAPPPASSLKTTGAAVVISGASPPSAGQIFTAITATIAEWVTPTPPASTGFVPTGIQGGSILAAVGELVLIDATVSSNVTLPTAPTNGAQVAMKIIGIASFSVPVTPGGGDFVELGAGLTLTVAREWAVLIYDSANTTWYQIA